MSLAGEEGHLAAAGYFRRRRSLYKEERRRELKCSVGAWRARKLSQQTEDSWWLCPGEVAAGPDGQLAGGEDSGLWS